MKLKTTKTNQTVKITNRQYLLAALLFAAGVYVANYGYDLLQSRQHGLWLREVVFAGYVVVMAGVGYLASRLMKVNKTDATNNVIATIAGSVLGSSLALFGASGVFITIISATAIMFVGRYITLEFLRLKFGSMWMKILIIAMFLVVLHHIIGLEALKVVRNFHG